MVLLVYGSVVGDSRWWFPSPVAGGTLHMPGLQSPLLHAGREPRGSAALLSVAPHAGAAPGTPPGPHSPRRTKSTDFTPSLNSTTHTDDPKMISMNTIKCEYVNQVEYVTDEHDKSDTASNMEN